MRVFADDHTVSAVAGYSYWENNSENFDMSNYDFPVDGVGAWDMGTGSWLSDGKAAMSSHKYPRERIIAGEHSGLYQVDGVYPMKPFCMMSVFLMTSKYVSVMV